MNLQTNSFFKTANFVEAGVWIAIGIAFACFALTKSPFHKRAFAAAIVFVLFGVSDVVETQTGAWWRPWWLLCWKGLCILSMLMLYVRHKLGRIATEDLAASSTAYARITNPKAMAAEITDDTECNACGYNLRGLTAGGNCPECGHPIKRTLAAQQGFHLRGEHLMFASFAIYCVGLFWSVAAHKLGKHLGGIPVYVALGEIAPIVLGLSAILMYFIGPKTRGVHVYLYIMALAITGFLYFQFCIAVIASA
ncbi:MAG TPA: hypothetical protein PKN33_03660 [Phycisphaerae bacterium]|nr:hypothetical protein [Phycisphaerae bacterium]